MKKNTYLLIASLLTLLNAGCEKKETATPVVTPTANTSTTPTGTNGTTLTISSTEQFTGTLDGAAISFVKGSTDFRTIVGSSKNLSTSSTSQAAYSSSVFSNKTSNGFDVSIGGVTFTGSNKPSLETFQSLFKKGDYPYNTDEFKGVQIIFNNGPGKILGSSSGTADQTGSVFTITDLAVSSTTVKIIATIKCKVYDYTSGAESSVNGTYICSFEHQ